MRAAVVAEAPGRLALAVTAELHHLVPATTPQRIRAVEVVVDLQEPRRAVPAVSVAQAAPVT
jgi:hypothetical protein